MASKVSSILEEIGFFKLEKNLGQLFKRAACLAQHAGSSQDIDKLAAFPSSIPAESIEAKPGYVLSIDIGGTSTKAGVREVMEDKKVKWHYLFEIKNLDLGNLTNSSHSFQTFCDLLAKQLALSLKHVGIPVKKISACGLVWSNALVNRKGKSGSIIAEVAGRALSAKGEWFLKDLKDGDNLNEFFLKSFEAQGISIGRILIANDTVLTMKVVPGADSGVVASTGLNSTILKNGKKLGISEVEEDIICNAESGGHFILDSALASKGDFFPRESDFITLESLSSGKFLPKILTQHIEVLANSGLDDLLPLSEHLNSLGDSKWEEFRSRDLSLLLYDKEFFLNRRTDSEYYTETVLGILEELAHLVLERGGMLASVVAYASISNRIETKESFLISLDSRLSREVPLFKEKLQQSLEIALPNDKKVKINLCEPLLIDGGSISIPMLGAVNAVDCV